MAVPRAWMENVDAQLAASDDCIRMTQASVLKLAGNLAVSLEQVDAALERGALNPELMHNVVTVAVEGLVSIVQRLDDALGRDAAAGAPVASGLPPNVLSS